MEHDEAYVAIDGELLRIVKEVLGEELLPPTAPTVRISVGTYRLLLRLARIDQVTGRYVIGVKLFRDLDPRGRPPAPPPPPAGGPPLITRPMDWPDKP